MDTDLTYSVNQDMFASGFSFESPPKRTGQQVSDLEDGGSPSKKGKANRGGMFGPIPSCYEDAGPEDRKILQMRDDEGRGWSDISEAIGWMTGTHVRSTSLLNRYKKMKLNFVVFEDKDVNLLFQCKKDVEDRFEVEKWQKIADSIESKTGVKYPAFTVQKKFKEAMKLAECEMWD